ncbi:MAG: flagellar hook-associated protein FlgK [Desulfobacterales bacterium]|jgi:flagellar hook-associated protein 1
MANIIGLLDIGKSALLVHQQSINVTGHNIANVNTPGYTRQRVNLAANSPLDSSPGQMGDGVVAVNIQRVYDRYINARINTEQQGLGRWEAQKSAMQNLEVVFDEAGGYGLDRIMTEFWSAWQELSNSPSGYTERVSLVSKSETLAWAFNKTAADLQQQRVDLDAVIQGGVDEINALASQIADLNRKIGEIETGPQNANDLRDRRDLLVTRLSELADVNTFEDGQGRISVSIGNGRPLVDNAQAWRLGTTTNAAGHLNVTWIDSSGTAADITANINGGKLKGWLEVRDGAITDVLTRLDAMAANLADAVNTLHTTGYDLYAALGQTFFSGSTAGDIGVNIAVSADPNRIAAAATAAGAPGDNAIAVAMADLQQAAVMGGGTASLEDFYRALVTDVGNQVRSAADFAEHQSVMMTSLDNHRESIAGVSLDEEMLNLIKFQHAFDAAAKLVTTVDQMIQTVMDMTR